MGFFRSCICCHRPSDEVEHQWDPPQVIDGDSVSSGAVRVFKWYEVEKMMGEFMASAVIGEGGFSTVYIGRLPESKGEVTVPGAFKADCVVLIIGSTTDGFEAGISKDALLPLTLGVKQMICCYNKIVLDQIQNQLEIHMLVLDVLINRYVLLLPKALILV